MAIQKVHLRVAGLQGDAPGSSLLPVRALPNGHAVTLVPNFDIQGALKEYGPDGLTELTVPVPIACTIENGVLTHRGQPYVWIPAPTPDYPGWNWTLKWESDLTFGRFAKRLRDFTFDVEAATTEQIADTDYAGVNLAPLFPGILPNTGTPILQGPDGLSVASVAFVGGALQFTMTSGEILDPVPLPSLTDAVAEAQNAADDASASASSITGAVAAATGKASEAATSATNAASAASTASGHSSTALTRANAASGSATAAAGSASTAATHADSAESSADAAAQSAIEAADAVSSGLPNDSVTRTKLAPAVRAELDSTVKTVNGAAPDGAGNVTVSGGGGSTVVTKQIPIGFNSYMAMRSGAARTDALSKMKTASKSDDPITREDIVWSDVQPTESGGFVWSATDALVSACADAGVRVLMILDHPPVWATAAGASSVASSWVCPPYPGVVTAGGNSALAAYAVFAGAVAARYGPNGTFWTSYTGTDRPAVFEVWNEEYIEPTSKRWNGTTAVSTFSDPVGAAAFTSAAAKAIHAAGGRIAAGVTMRTPNATDPMTPYAKPFLEALTEPIDILSVHSYTYGYVAASHTPTVVYGDWRDRVDYFATVQDIRTLTDELGLASAELWVTETGFPTHPTGLTETQQTSRYNDLWDVVRGNPAIDALIIFCLTKFYSPDNPSLPGYDANSPENFLALWHTGSTTEAVGSAKPAVAAITAQAPIVRSKTGTAAVTYDGELDQNVRVTAASLPTIQRSHLSDSVQADLATAATVNPANYYTKTAADARFAPISGALSGKRTLASTMRPGSWTSDTAVGVTTCTASTTVPTWTSAKAPAVADLLKYVTVEGGTPTNMSNTYWVNAISGYGGGLGDSTPCDLVFNFDSTHFAVELVALGNFDWKLWVDDRPYGGENFTVTTASYGAKFYLNVVFSAAADRTIRVSLGHAALPVRVNFEKTANLFPATAPDFRVGYVADSWGTGQATTEGFVSGGAVPQQFRRATGWEVLRFCQGGTGWVSDPSGSAGSEPTPFGSTVRLDAMSVQHAIKPFNLIMFAGSLNDKTVSATKAAVKSAALAAFAACATRFPGVPIIAAGVQPIETVTSTLSADLNAGIYEAALAATNVVQFVNWLTDPTPWITGTGRTGALTGDGNRDFVIAADNLHLEQRGNRYIGRRLRESVKSISVGT